MFLLHSSHLISSQRGLGSGISHEDEHTGRLKTVDELEEQEWELRRRQGEKGGAAGRGERWWERVSPRDPAPASLARKSREIAEGWGRGEDLPDRPGRYQQSYIA